MNPLQMPENDAPLLREFMRIHALDQSQPPASLLTDVATAFARLPFENLTKIIKDAEAGRVEEARYEQR